MFYVCKHCGNVITYLNDSGVKVKCCGEDMELINPNTSDGAKEKHMPIIKDLGDSLEISVSEVMHPMSKEHLIDWIYVETPNSGRIINFKDTDEPTIKIPKEEVINIYSHCNLHGLWKLEIK